MKINNNVLFIMAVLNLIPIAVGLFVIEDPPLSLIIHIASSAIFGVMGALQMIFIKTKKRVTLHRSLGPMITLAGILSASSGLWMTLANGTLDGSSTLLMGIRLFFGSLMLLFLSLGIREIIKANFVNHGKWMLRAYAIGFGAVSQIFTLMIGEIVLGSVNPNAKALLMGTAWLINLIVAERVIMKSKTKKL